MDYPNYLVPVGAADIFFPTNFKVLELLHRHYSQDRDYSAQTFSTAEFMRAFADFERCRTKSGYNPLLEDYSNMKIFTAQLRTFA
jgi:hypothetical protein